MAQLDRATVCGTVGRRFESCWAHHTTRGGSLQKLSPSVPHSSPEGQSAIAC